jgi:hypothetical protein
MKTFLMIYNSKTRELLDEYEEFNDPIGAFNTWYFEGIVETSFEDLNEIIVFYFTGSENIELRKSGILEFEKNTGRMKNIEHPLYHVFYDDGINCVYHNSKHIIWSNNRNSYMLSLIKNDEVYELDEDLDDFSLPLEVLIPPMELFTASRIKYHFYSKERGRIHTRFEHMPLQLNRFFKKCKSCKNNTVLEIENMVSGRFSCSECKKIQ